MQREEGSPGAARAADELEIGRRIRRVLVSKTDANPYRILQTAMVTVGMKDWCKEVPVAEDDGPDPVDSADVLSGDNAGDAIEAEANAPAAPAADTDDSEGGSGLQDFHHRLHVLSPERAPYRCRRGPPLSASRPS